jgi:hypothetical protein
MPDQDSRAGVTDVVTAFVRERDQLAAAHQHERMIVARLIAALMGKRKKKVLTKEVWDATEGVQTFIEDTETGGVVIRVEYPDHS